MQVSALIELLKAMPMDSIVITEGYENGYDSIKEVNELYIERNPETNWWDGEYIKDESQSGTKAVYLYARNRNA